MTETTAMPTCDVKTTPRNPEDSPEARRFSGYNLPTVRLDDGFDYYVVEPHPSLLDQPQFFQKPAFEVGFETAGGRVEPLLSPAMPSSRAASPPPVLPI